MTSLAIALLLATSSVDAPPASLDAGSVEDAENAAGNPFLEAEIPKPDALPIDASTPVEVFLWQTLVGGGTCLVLVCPGAPLTLGASLIAGPAVVGWAVANLGDNIGKSRGPWLWSLVGAYTASTLFGGGLVGASIIALLIGLNISTSGAGFAAQQLIIFGVLAGGAVSVAATSLAAGAGAALGYALTAESKRPGDDGSNPAGFSAPGHPDDRRAPNQTEQDDDVEAGTSIGAGNQIPSDDIPINDDEGLDHHDQNEQQRSDGAIRAQHY